jgi:hypothetical protein
LTWNAIDPTPAGSPTDTAGDADRRAPVDEERRPAHEAEGVDAGARRRARATLLDVEEAAHVDLGGRVDLGSQDVEHVGSRGVALVAQHLRRGCVEPGGVDRPRRRELVG